VARMTLRWTLEAHFELFLAVVARLALTWFLEARFELILAESSTLRMQVPRMS